MIKTINVIMWFLGAGEVAQVVEHLPKKIQ
jgi:hypothetical protein